MLGWMGRKVGLRVCALAVLLGSAACASKQAPDSTAATAEPPPIAYGTSEYRCGEQRLRLVVAADAIELKKDDEYIAMQQVVAASGAKFAAVDDAATIFWDKGEAARFEWRGVAYPECRKLSAETLGNVLRAEGQQPAWQLTLDEFDIELVLNYGDETVRVPTPAVQDDGVVVRYRLPDATGIAIERRPCADPMSGVFHPLTVTIERGDAAWRGCGGRPVDVLLGEEWVVAEIGDEPVAAGQVTIRFSEEGTVAGQAGCNRFDATWLLTDEGLVVGEGATTMHECTTEQQELQDSFLRTLVRVRRYSMTPERELVLQANDGRRIVARR